jgi:hypothetical protein
MKLTGENRQLGEKPVPVPLCPPQTPHGLIEDWTRASTVEGRRLTAWAMARPIQSLNFFFQKYCCRNTKSEAIFHCINFQLGWRLSERWICSSALTSVTSRRFHPPDSYLIYVSKKRLSCREAISLRQMESNLHFKGGSCNRNSSRILFPFGLKILCHEWSTDIQCVNFTWGAIFNATSLKAFPCTTVAAARSLDFKVLPRYWIYVLPQYVFQVICRIFLLGFDLHNLIEHTQLSVPSWGHNYIYPV